MSIKHKLKVYISSPYSEGDQASNVREQMDVADRLIEVDYAPFIPLLYHFQHITYPRGYIDWLNLDLEWIASCNVVLRLPGKSANADAEVRRAIALNIPVVYSYEELIEEYPPN